LRRRPLPGLPFDADRGVVTNVDGRVCDEDRLPLPGEYVAGWIKDMFTTMDHGVEIVNYRMVFIIPCILTVLCAVIFVLSFREKKPELAAARSHAG